MRAREALDRLRLSRRRDRVDFGSLRRITPFSRDWGWDRGTPVDRYYIARFLDRRRGDVRGRVLEVGDRMYTERFGDGEVTRSDVLHLDASNPAATVVADLNVEREPAIPDSSFDCIILTQSLQFVYELRHAVANLHRALKPGGVLLTTVPGICAAQPGSDSWSDEWCWSFTRTSVERLLGEEFGAANLEVEVSGNVLAASAFLYGLADDELEAIELDARDPAYPVIVAARAVKR